MNARVTPALLSFSARFFVVFLTLTVLAFWPSYFARLFEQPNIWDVAGGIVLARAAGRQVMVRQDKVWQPFDSFAQVDPSVDPASEEPGVHRVLRDWRRSLILGEEVAVARACEIFA